MNRILRHFDVLVKYGLKVIPLREQTKIPVYRGWVHWDHDKARGMVERNPNFNLGILLGEILDVEGDTEEANEKIDDLVRGVAHPSYRSSKSTHHLFLSPDPKLTILKYKGIEFRGHRHQSAVPPSIMPGEVKYRWLEDTIFPIPPLPDRLLSFFHTLRRTKPSVKPGHLKVVCNCCNKTCYMHRKRFDLEVLAFRELGFKWTCHKCREFDVRPMCRKLRKSTASLV